MPLMKCKKCGAKILVNYYPEHTEIIDSKCPRCGDEDKVMCLGESDFNKHYWDAVEYNRVVEQLLEKDEGLPDEIFDANDPESCLYEPEFYDLIKDDIRYHGGSTSRDIGIAGKRERVRKGL